MSSYMSPIYTVPQEQILLSAKKSDPKLGKKKKSRNSSYLKLISSKSKWLWIMIICSLIIVTIVTLITTIVVTNYSTSSLVIPIYSWNTTIGKPCTTTSNCIANAYCNIISGRAGVCTCINTYYFDTSSATCLQSVTFNKSCSSNDQCLSTISLTCISNICQCNSKQFWNYTALECQDKKAPQALCQGWGDCPSNSACTNTYPLYVYSLYSCLCNGGYYFNTNTGACELLSFVGSTCTHDYECVANAVCTTTSSSSTTICVCIFEKINSIFNIEFKFIRYVILFILTMVDIAVKNLNLMAQVVL